MCIFHIDVKWTMFARRRARVALCQCFFKVIVCSVAEVQALILDISMILVVCFYV